MQKVIAITGLLLFFIVMSTGWQVASCEFANYQLKDDLHDVAVMSGSRIGLLALASDDDLRDAVIRKAAGHNIHLARAQIFVVRGGTGDNQTVFLAAKYKARLALPGASLIFHFTATSE